LQYLFPEVEKQPQNVGPVSVAQLGMVGHKLFVPVSPVPHTAKGRQEKTFTESSKRSKRSKRRKTEGLRKTTSTEELFFATAMSLQGSGNPSAAKLLHEVVATTPTRASKICQAWSEKKGGDCNVEIFGR
jgi:hypothetical protein